MYISDEISRHSLVLYKNHIYTVEVITPEGKPIPYGNLRYSVAAILNDATPGLEVNFNTVTSEPERDMAGDLLAGLLAIPGTHLNGDAAQRLPGNVNITFDGVEAETLLLLLDEAGICASAGSACSAGAVEPSHVLLALGLTPAQAKSTLRLTLDAANAAEEIDTAAAVITACVQRLRDGVR